MVDSAVQCPLAHVSLTGIVFHLDHYRDDSEDAVPIAIGTIPAEVTKAS